MTKALMGAMIAVIAIAGIGAGDAADPQYPARPMRIIVPFPPGATTDVIARMVGQKFTEVWGHPVVVDNHGGASGNGRTRLQGP